MSANHRYIPLSEAAMGFSGPRVNMQVKNTFIEIPEWEPTCQDEFNITTAPPKLNKEFLLCAMRQAAASPLKKHRGCTNGASPEKRRNLKSPEKRRSLTYTEWTAPTKAEMKPPLAQSRFSFAQQDDEDLEQPLQLLCEDHVDDITLKEGEGALPSLGSANHFDGTCKSCTFFPRGRCKNGVECTFCHFDHEKRHRKKKSKASRAANALRKMWPTMNPYLAPPPAPAPSVPSLRMSSMSENRPRKMEMQNRMDMHGDADRYYDKQMWCGQPLVERNVGFY